MTQEKKCHEEFAHEYYEELQREHDRISQEHRDLCSKLIWWDKKRREHHVPKPKIEWKKIKWGPFGILPGYDEQSLCPCCKQEVTKVYQEPEAEYFYFEYCEPCEYAYWWIDGGTESWKNTYALVCLLINQGDK